MPKETNNISGTILAFDFGMKHIGVAVGQTITKSATPLMTLPAQGGEPAWQDIKAIIDEWKPAMMIVGIPLNMDGSRQAITENADTFRDALEEHFKLPVVGMDERLSTVEARNQIFEEHGYKGLSKDKINAVSAALILESWFVTASGI